MKKIFMIIGLLLCFSSYSQFYRHTLEGALGVNNHVYGLGVTDIAPQANLTYKYNVSEKFAVGVRASYDLLKDKGLGLNTDALNISPAVYYKVLNTDKFDIVGHLGAGYSILDGQGTPNVIVGGAAYYKLRKNLDVMLNYNIVNYFFQEDHVGGLCETTSTGLTSFTNELSIGLAYHFGKYIKEPIQIVEDKDCCQTIVNEITNTQVVEQTFLPVEIVTFREGKSDIDKDSHGAIYRVYKFMQDNPEYNVVVTGSSCFGHGSDERNQELSEQRASNVANKLTSMGIASQRISHMGIGKDTEFKHEDQEYQKKATFLFYK